MKLRKDQILEKEHLDSTPTPQEAPSHDALPLQVPSKALDRRTMLQMIGGVVGATMIAGCGGGSTPVASTTGGTATTGGTTTTSGTTTTTGTTTTGGTTSGGTCAVTPEGEIGPYFTDDSAAGYNRSNILTNLDGSGKQAGIPLALKVYVYDAQNGCTALQGAQVDIWHCNASGVYSNEASQNTLGQNWLRGEQVTDATGLAAFTTIIPGWYQGRTTHIHLRVRSKYSQASSTGDGTNTTQLFFPQALLNTIYASIAPYNARGINSTTNANDHVYTPETHGATELALVGDTTNGYAATASIYLPITAE